MNANNAASFYQRQIQQATSTDDVRAIEASLRTLLESAEEKKRSLGLSCKGHNGVDCSIPGCGNRVDPNDPEFSLQCGNCQAIVCIECKSEFLSCEDCDESYCETCMDENYNELLLDCKSCEELSCSQCRDRTNCERCGDKVCDNCTVQVHFDNYTCCQRCRDDYADDGWRSFSR